MGGSRKEVKAVRKLARRLGKRFGKMYFDLIIYDGLCRYELIQYIQEETGSHVIVKTNLGLTGEQIRRFCIRRWRIEDSGFRQLNMFGRTKRIYSKHVEIAVPLIGLLILAHNLFLYFLSEFKKGGEDKTVKRGINNLKYYYKLLMRNTYNVGGRYPLLS